MFFELWYFEIGRQCVKKSAENLKSLFCEENKKKQKKEDQKNGIDWKKNWDEKIMKKIQMKIEERIKRDEIRWEKLLNLEIVNWNDCEWMWLRKWIEMISWCGFEKKKKLHERDRD